MPYERFALSFKDLLQSDTEMRLWARFEPALIKRWQEGSALPTHREFMDLVNLFKGSRFDGDALAPLKAEWQAAIDAAPDATLHVKLPARLSEAKFDIAKSHLQHNRRVKVARHGSYAVMEGNEVELSDIELAWIPLLDDISAGNSGRRKLTLPVPPNFDMEGVAPILDRLHEDGVVVKFEHMAVGSNGNPTSITISGSRRYLNRARILWDEYVSQSDEYVLRSDKYVLHSPEAKPIIPKPGPASRFQHTHAGFEIESKLLVPEEASDPIQRAIYSRLLIRVNRLRDSIQGLQNSNRELYDEFNDYASLLTGDAGQLDVASIWSTGAALSDLVEAHDPNNISGMTEPVEGQILAGLRAVLRDHMAFVEGTAVGREMRERVAQYRRADKTPNELTALSGPTLAALLNVKGLLASGAQHLVGSVKRGIDFVGEATLQLAVTSMELARNAVLGIGRSLYASAAIPGVAHTAMGFVGIDDGSIAAAMTLFDEYGPVILALTVNERQLRAFVEWILAAVKTARRDQLI
jgi:hypothetical protein